MKFSPILLACAVLIAPLAAAAQDASSATYNETRLSALESQTRDLQGRIEQAEYNIRRIDQALQRMQADTDQRLTALEHAQAAQAAAPQPQVVVAPPPPPQQQQPGAPQPVPLSAPPADPNPNGTLGSLQIENGHVTGAVNDPHAPALPPTPPDYGLTPQEQYDRAFGLLQQANYGEAEAAFKNFIDKNPKDKLVGNAKYWYGETLYVRAQYDQSAVAFADAYQSDPRGSKAPDSLLKLGMSLEALRKVPDACVTFGELRDKYPHASAAIKARAKEERARLKCRT